MPPDGGVTVFPPGLVVVLPPDVVVFSSTIIVLTFVVSFPCESFTLYVIVYVPAFYVFTLPEISIFDVKSPSLSSLAVAPFST